jgi:hypothetical protein
MANRAGTGQHPAGLVCMAIVVATKTAWPITMTDVVGIGCPVDLHAWKDIPAIDYGDGLNRLVDLGLLLLEDARIILSIVRFNRLPDGFAYVLLVIVFFYQCV